jgi:copper chaperone CopZ
MVSSTATQAVTSELSKLDGVESVQVDLAANSVTVISAEALAVVEVAAAIDEAGFELFT